MSLLPFFQWCENSGVGETIRNSSWLFPVIESFHLLGLAVIGGAVLVVDLRLFGFGLRRQSVAQLAQDAQRWLIRQPGSDAAFRHALPRRLMGEDVVPVAGDR